VPYIQPEHFEHIGYALPFEERHPIDFGPFLSLPDLIAGALADYFQRTRETGEPSVSSDESDQIVKFVGFHGLMLRKLTYKIEKMGADQYSSNVIEFVPRDAPPGSLKVEITV
jgi:hypothetical protein